MHAVIQQMEGQSGATIERKTVTQRLTSMTFCAVCDLARHVPAFAGGRLSNNLGPLQVILPAYKCLSRQPEAKNLLPMMDYQYARALKTCLPQVLAPLHAAMQEHGTMNTSQPAPHCAFCVLLLISWMKGGITRGCMRQVAPRPGSVAGIIERCESMMGVDVDWREGRENPRYRAFERMMQREDALRLCKHL